MHHSEPFSLALKSPEQGFGGKNCQNGSQGKTLIWLYIYAISGYKTDILIHVNIFFIISASYVVAH